MASRSVQPKIKGIDFSGLTAQQQLFVMYLLGSTDFNVAAAARSAGYAQPKKAGWQLLQKPSIRKALGKMQTMRVANMAVANEEILEQLDHFVMFDPADLFDENGVIIADDISRIPEMTRKCIASLKLKQAIDKEGNRYQQIEMKFVDRIAAARLVMLHRGLLSPTKEKAKPEFSIDWDRLAKPWVEGEEPDPIEEAIRDPAKYLASQSAD